MSKCSWFIDGKIVESLIVDDFIDKNADYNGMVGKHCRTLVLIWDTFGKILDCDVNIPGSFHDILDTLWCDLYDHIENLPYGYFIVYDSSFNTSNINGKIIKSKYNPYNYFINDDNRLEFYEVSDKYRHLTALRQWCEWDNSILVSVLSVLKNTFPCDNRKRNIILWSCVLLHNWNVSTMDIT